MKKSEVNTILVNQAKRRNAIISSICFMVVALLLAALLTIAYYNKQQVQYASYKESANTDYKVYLKHNDYYDDEYAEMNNQYVSELVNYINANFKYDFALDRSDVDYSYSYMIDAYVSVSDNASKRILYDYTKELVKENKKTSSSKTFSIDKDVKIVYADYASKVKSFVDNYNLSGVTSTLTVSLHVYINSNCSGYTNDVNESVVSLEIPLNTPTFGIDKTDNLVKSDKNVITCSGPLFTNVIILVIAIALYITVFVSLIKLVRYIDKTRSAESVYDKNIKKILNNYASYIERISNNFDFSRYRIFEVKDFRDMLEIRDTVSQPILMIENKEEKTTYFVIPTDSSILYVHRINVEDIKTEIEKERREEALDDEANKY